MTTPEERPTSLDDPLGTAWVRVLRGNPTPEELAAVTVMLVTLAAGRGEAPPVRPPAGAAWKPGMPTGCSFRSWKAHR
ncbi:acyl-CoA carboxylase subunit epsilon [Streptomyces anulatus]|uniref:acyl-CoA carboxylase subunit epsilon n=1 Tax=Streptomyces anulatus TaxID=1892 RepID=UPI003700A6C0